MLPLKGVIVITKHSDNYNRALLAEIYDQSTMSKDDINLLLSLMDTHQPLNILEVFCGTGRMLIPLLEQGHKVTGIELAPAMALRAEAKAAEIGHDAQERLTLKVQDALNESWGVSEYDVVIIGCNALYELATAESQAACIRRAFDALKPGGKLFIDNNNWVTPLEEEVGRKWVALEGTAADGTYCRQSAETVGVEPAQGIMHIRRTWYTRTTDGVESSEEYMGVKRTLSGAEVNQWLTQTGFGILKRYGEAKGNPYSSSSPRAIFWCEKQ